MQNFKTLTKRRFVSDPLEYAANTASNSDFKPKLKIVSHMDERVLNNVIKQKESAMSKRSDSQVNEKSSSRGSRPHKKVPNLNSTISSLPKKFEGYFNSGINAKLVIDKNSDFNGEYTHLFLMNGSFFNQSKGYNSSSIYEYFYRHVFIEYKLAIQYALGNRTFSNFSSDDLYDYFHRVCFALQVYYQVDSLISYFQDDTNRPYNEGMVHLRSFLKPETYSEFEELRDLLLDLPCPKNLVHFIKHMYQSFTFSQDNDSTIYRLGCEFTFYSDETEDGIENSILSDAISLLKDVDLKMPLIIGRSIPDLKIGELPPSLSKPIYDVNFRNFWSNCNVSYIKSGLINYSRKVNDADSHFNYVVYNEEADGLIYSCLSVYNLANDAIESGLWAPISDVSFYKDVKGDQSTSILYYDSKANALRSLNHVGCLCQSSLYHGIVRTKPAGGGDALFVDYVNSHVGSLRTIMNSVNKCKEVCYDSIRYLLGINNSLS